MWERLSPNSIAHFSLFFSLRQGLASVAPPSPWVRIRHSRVSRLFASVRGEEERRSQFKNVEEDSNSWGF